MHGGDTADKNWHPVVKVTGVSFSYSRRAQALRKVSFEVRRGERVGLVGPNGSGKSTLIRLIADLLQLSQGSIRIDGRSHQKRASREDIAYIAGNDYLPQFLTGREYVELMHRLYGRLPDPARMDDLFIRYQMGSRQSHLIEDYSHGMRKKVQVISSLLLERPLTIIDETLNGVDVDSLFEFETDARRIGDGRALLLCSHDFRLLEAVCDRVIVLCCGEIFFDLPLAQAKDDFGTVDALVRHAVARSGPGNSP